ncbi:anhydro-N-acetylmuramic acid kinase [Polycladidibacter hongkongensis]|uniref:anhydro-N-acetylmuramic acid kinase n=1 Tax=Polycladidibacter hongkongensis TaxID=1647556 RepID=UPI00082BA266|nr:anhydro-N-acetylmuramic acid kinase [Pseudovibrio hongkongensis]
MSAKWLIGLMTGTVADGNIDVALLKTDGEKISETGPHALLPYTQEENRLIKGAIAAAQDWQFAKSEPQVFAEAEDALTRAQSRAVLHFLQDNKLSAQDIAAIGFHGQTVLHRPPTDNVPGATRQLGNGELMAQLTRIPVVYDFRSADVRAGGHGAPLVPVYHRALMRTSSQLQRGQSIAALNLGGVANLTWWDGKDGLIAFDCGPANAPINDWISHHGAGDYDDKGRIAASALPDFQRVDTALAHPYFILPPPKSLDRNSFTWRHAKDLPLAIGAATLTHISAGAVAAGLAQLPQSTHTLVVCGGGRHNLHFMQLLGEKTGANIINADALGWQGDAIEAQCFAFLAMRHLRGLHSSYASTTGVRHACVLGELATPA